MASQAVLVVGSDSLGNLPVRLQARGYGEIIHWDGRRRRQRGSNLPKRVKAVVVLCDRVNHQLMQNVKRQSKAAGIPVVYTDEFNDLGWGI
jgi:hypothetical protein